MPRKKKTAREMTDEELAKKVFPKKVREAVKEEARESSGKRSKSSSQDKDNR